jgi:long-subunit acyl-CoA synthetase (AMP-forming)
VCEGLKQLEKYYEISKHLPNLKALVMDWPDALPLDIESKCAVPVYTFEDFLVLVKDISNANLKACSDSCKSGEMCILIYTSGTTFHRPAKGRHAHQQQHHLDNKNHGNLHPQRLHGSY